jgi:hypothetical protein
MAKTIQHDPNPAPRVILPTPIPAHAPREGQMLVVDLPGERLRTEVVRVVNPDVVIVELAWQPMAKTHQYGLGDMVPVRRDHGPLGEEVWRAFRPQPSAEIPVIKPRPKSRGKRGKGLK